MITGALLAAVDVAYSYPVGTPALSGVSLDVVRGQRLALLGGNGSGKSTLLLTLNATLAPSSGHVEFAGTVLGSSRRDRNEHRRRVGLVLQDPDDQLFSASVFEDISFGPLNLGLDDDTVRQRVESVLEQFSLLELADRPAHLLSFGQRKRVAIAGVAAMQPEVMLLDEPFAGLDPVARNDVLRALSQLEASGTTVVLTTHDVDLAYAWADRVTLMGDGIVVADGTPDVVLADVGACAASRLQPPALVGLLAAAVAAGWIDRAAASRLRSVDALAEAIRNRSEGALRDALRDG